MAGIRCIAVVTASLAQQHVEIPVDLVLALLDAAGDDEVVKPVFVAGSALSVPMGLSILAATPADGGKLGLEWVLRIIMAMPFTPELRLAIGDLLHRYAFEENVPELAPVVAQVRSAWAIP
jgi:hypothetical protein